MAALRTLDTETADRDLTTSVTVLTHTVTSGPTWCTADIRLGDGAKNLDGTGGTFEVKVVVAGNTVHGGAIGVVQGTDVRSSLPTFAFWVGDDAEVTIAVESPNAADTDVAVTCVLADVSPLQPATQGRTIIIDSDGAASADVTKLSEDATAADNLEATYDGTGYENEVAPAQQRQVAGVSSTGSPTKTPLTSDSVITTGAAQGGTTWADAVYLDGDSWQIADAAGEIDVTCEFNVGNNGVPVEIKMVGRLNGVNDELDVFGWDYSTSSWGAIGTLEGKALATDDPHFFDLYDTMVGDGANAGQVKLRFYGTGLTSANLYLQQIFSAYSTQFSAVGYAMGRIWVNTTDGTAGSVENVNGVADLPSDNWADTLLLQAATNLSDFAMAGNSAITLDANSDYYRWYGEEWDLALGGQSIARCLVTGALVTGTSAGTNARFYKCKFGVVSLTACGMSNCAITNTITLLSAGTYTLDGCFSAGTAVVDFGAAVGDTTLKVQHFGGAGGLEIQNLGANGTDVVHLSGDGELTLNANCAGGTVNIDGSFKLTDNSGGAVTVNDDARWGTDQLSDLATEAKQDTAQADLDLIAGTDGATLASAQGNYAPAKAGDLMGLVADAITSAKFDETTAFPVEAVDSGATQIARTGADGDTLETLSDEIAALHNITAADVTTALAAVNWTAGGAASYQDIVIALYSYVRGRFSESSDTYSYYDDDGDASGGTLLFSHAVTTTARTPV